LLLLEVLEHPAEIVAELPRVTLAKAMQFRHYRVIPHG
jgi:hypothetical protein